MKNHFTAILAALFITVCVGAAMTVASASAYFNKNGVMAASSPASATATAAVTSAQDAQVQQLQSLVNQYQARETQYQNELATAGQQLQAANQQVQQYQLILQALQNRGVIRVDENGRISIP
jgi:flagellar motor protein MotB